MDAAGQRRKMVEPAFAEYRVETGPRNKVTAIEFWFQLKDLSDVVAAEREREASRIGRKARRKGSVETITALDLPPPDKARKIDMARRICQRAILWGEVDSAK